MAAQFDSIPDLDLYSVVNNLEVTPHEVIEIKNLRGTDSLATSSGVFNDLIVFSNTLNQPSGPAVQVSTEPKLTSIHKKIACGFYQIFMQIQEELEEQERGDSEDKLNKAEMTQQYLPLPNLLHFSHEYRAVLTNVCLTWKQETDATFSSESVNIDLQQEPILTMEFIWHLYEALYLVSYEDNSRYTSAPLLAENLALWIRTQRNTTESLYQSLLSIPQTAPDTYWDTIYILLIQGKMNEIIKLLVQFSKHNPSIAGPREMNLVSHVADLISRWPLALVNKEPSMNQQEKRSRWNSWNNECKQLVSRGDLQSLPELDLMGRLMAGEMDAFKNLRQNVCPTWYDMMVGLVLYTNPFVEVLSIDLMKLVKETYVMYRATGKLDKVLLNIFVSSIVENFNELSILQSNLCILSHLGDLLFRAGQQDLARSLYSSKEKSESVTLREHLMLGYASGLMGHPSLWKMGADYLALACPLKGLHCAADYLERLGAQSNEKKAIKVIEVCQKYNLLETRKNVCKVQARAAVNNRRLGQAIMWCLKGQDAVFTKIIVDTYLLEYTLQGSFDEYDLLENLGSSMLLSKRLTFLSKYCEFHSLYRSGDVKTAANLLIQLLRSKMAPKSFWITMLLDTIPILELEEPIISSEDTYELMSVLQELSTSYAATEYLTCCHPDKRHEENTTYVRDKLIFLRRALARNLAKPFLTVMDHTNN